MSWGTVGCTVVTAKDGASTVLFSKSGQITIRQIELVETTEVRGLTKANAEGRVTAPTYSANWAETTYYKTIDGAQYSFVGRTGTETRHAARRVDETDQWVYTQTVTTYSLNVDPTTSAGGGWSTSSGSTLSANGIEVPVSSDKTVSYQYKYAQEYVYATVTTSVTEYRHCTQAGAAAYVARSSANAVMKYHWYTDPDTSTRMAWSVFMDGTDTVYASRFISTEEGWTVTKTQKVYGWTGGSHWSLGGVA